MITRQISVPFTVRISIIMTLFAHKNEYTDEQDSEMCMDWIHPWIGLDWVRLLLCTKF